MTEGAPNGSMACCTIIPSSWRTVTASQHRVEARPLTAAGGYETTTGPKAVDVTPTVDQTVDEHAAGCRTLTFKP